MKLFFKSFGIITTIGLFVGTLWLFFNLQTTLDWIKLRSYEPTPEIAQLATDASFTDEGRRLFYVHYPELLDKANFQGKCTITEETIVLGCYISNQKIYVLDVDDERLEGVEQVTAAHEMLHAVYDRFSPSERDRIDSIVLSYYESATNERLEKTIESYRKRDPSIVPNELHSILATEIRELPEELDRHYSQYFIDRLSVVSLAEAYEDEFSKRQKQIEAFDEELGALSNRITSTESQIVQLGAALTVERLQLESLRTDSESYNNAVPSYNEKVEEYNSILESLRGYIASYNDIVQKRNAIAVEERELVDAIDSRGLEL
jgi:uncharacterized protein YukE